MSDETRTLAEKITWGMCESLCKTTGTPSAAQHTWGNAKWRGWVLETMDEARKDLWEKIEARWPDMSTNSNEERSDASTADLRIQGEARGNGPCTGLIAGGVHPRLAQTASCGAGRPMGVSENRGRNRPTERDY